MINDNYINKKLNVVREVVAGCDLQNVKVTHSTGMAIGSVPPNNHINCIKNVYYMKVVVFLLKQLLGA